MIHPDSVVEEQIVLESIEFGHTLSFGLFCPTDNNESMNEPVKRSSGTAKKMFSPLSNQLNYC